jgi:diaminopimelate epimerase
VSQAFFKYQGTGNDFILLDGLDDLPSNDWPEVATRLCDRHTGIGGDGLILVTAGDRTAFKMVIYNPDGSQPEMCGNGLRCFARYLHDQGRLATGPFPVETGAGILSCEVLLDLQVKVDMGAPVLERHRIPMGGARSAQVVDETLTVGEESFEITAVSMGNPHAVIFVKDVAAVPLAEWGPLLEHHPLFLERANIEFVQVLGPHEARMRVWERGAGPTLACGTGACATVVAGVLSDRLEAEATIHLPGGDLAIEWGADNHLWMTGPAELVFIGTILL